MTLNDAGQYICEVENVVGSASSIGVLKVLIPPTWKAQRPASEIHWQAESNQNVSINCSATGTPEPYVFWRREGRSDQEWNKNKSRWNVLPNGTLSIENAEPDDSGPLYCAAINAGGAILARVNLEITVPIDSVPSYFEIGPANQTLPIRSPALLQCQSHNSSGAVHWTRDDTVVQANASAGIHMLESGSLQIDHLRMEDSANYTCWSVTSSWTSSWTASLHVENPINPNVVFNRAPSDPLALPGPPTQPLLVNQTADSLTISWQSSSRMGASPLIGYTVEVYDPAGRLTGQPSWTWGRLDAQNNRTWTVLARHLKATAFSVDQLKGATWLLFLVRAENAHGLSLPSPVSKWIQTAAHWTLHPDLLQTRDLLSGSLLQLKRVVALNSTAVKLHWDIVDGESYIEGLYLFGFETDSGRHSMPTTPSQVIKDVSSMSLTLAKLRPDTNYTFFVIPFYGSVEGRPSNSQSVRTNQDGEIIRIVSASFLTNQVQLYFKQLIQFKIN